MGTIVFSSDINAIPNDSTFKTDLKIELSALDILNNSTSKLNGMNTSFICDLKVQSVSSEPIDYNFIFHSYWPNPDSLNYYNYIKFNSPIDYKNIEVWGHYHKKVLLKKKMPINNEITIIENDSENSNIINFFNFIELVEEIKGGKFSINETKFKNKDIFLIKAKPDNPKAKKKSTKFYIDKNDYSIYKIEWTNKKGQTSKTLLFKDWAIIDGINMSSKIIYEDIKNGTKLTCKLSQLELDNINQNIIDLINVGFKIEN